MEGSKFKGKRRRAITSLSARSSGTFSKGTFTKKNAKQRTRDSSTPLSGNLYDTIEVQNAESPELDSILNTAPMTATPSRQTKKKVPAAAVELEPVFSVKFSTDEQIKANICTKKECISTGNPHRHNLESCKDHPYCLAEPLKEQIPIFTTLPDPLPFDDQASGKQSFLDKVQKKEFGETGPQKPHTRTLVTQYSLEHYWAQQYNLDLDAFPASLPDHLDTVFELFGHNSKTKERSHNNFKAQSKQTLAKKMKGWTAGKEERAIMDLELMFLKSGQSHKFYNLLKQDQDSDGQEIDQKSGKRKKKVLLGKYTRPDQYTFEQPAKDMVPITWPDTMVQQPMIHKLNKQHNDITKLHSLYPQLRYHEAAELFFKKKKESKNIKKQQQQRTGNKVTETSADEEELNDRVKKRMDSEYLNSFMMQTEIQEIAERHEQFQELVRQRKSNGGSLDGNGISRNTRVRSKTVQADQIDHKMIGKLPGAPTNHRNQTLSQTLQFQPPQDQQTTAISMGKSLDRTSQSQSRRIERNKSSSMTATNTQLNSIRLKQALKIRPGRISHTRIFSSDKQAAKPKFELNDSINEQSQNQAPYLLEQDHLDKLVPTQSSRNNHVRASTIDQSNNRRHKAQSLQRSPRKMKTFTITVKMNKKDGAKRHSNSQKQERELNSDLNHQNHQPKPVQHDLFSEGLNSAFYKTMSIEGQENSHVLTDLIKDNESGKKFLQKAFKSSQWQDDKNKLIDAMQIHLEKHKPRLHLYPQRETKVNQLTCQKIKDQKAIFEQLGSKLQVKELTKVDVPKQYEAFISEVPTLLENKQKQDAKQMLADSIKKDACKMDFYKKRRVSFTNKSKRSTSQLCEKSKNDKSQTKQSRTDKSAQEKSIMDKQTTENETFNPTGVKISVANQQAFEPDALETKQVVQCNKDPKPDVVKIARERIQTCKTDFVKMVQLKINQRKERLKKDIDPFDDLNSQGGFSSDNANSPSQKSFKGHSESKSRPLSSQSQNQISKKLDSNLVEEKQSQTKCKYEPSAPGMGAPLTGYKLRKVIKSIVQALDFEIEEEPFNVGNDMELSMPELVWDPLKLNSHIVDMDGVEFWQQKGIQCQNKGRVDAALDYFRQGLRKNPTNLVLIYSIAICYSKLKKYQSAIHWFGKGIDLVPRWIDGLCGIAINYFNMLNFERAYLFIQLAKENSKGDKLKTAQFSFEFISFIHTTCLKMIGNFEESSKHYTNLDTEFQDRIAQDLVVLAWGLILIPLSYDRKLLADQYHNLHEYLTHMQELKLPSMDNQNLLLSKYSLDVESKIDYVTGKLKFCNYRDEPSQMDFAKFPKSLWTLIERKSFFKRFINLPKESNSYKLFKSIVERATVELYGKDQVVFLRDRIGIVMMGSVEIRKHNNNNLMKPFVVKKAIEGDVLGWADGDRQSSSSPLSWLLSMQDNTEVVFLDSQDWSSLWNIHMLFTEQQIVLQKLHLNPYFRKLNLLTQYSLVYESLEYKIYYPGQLIMSVHKRSPLCALYKEFYVEGTSKFRKEIENKVTKSGQEAPVSDYQVFMDVLKQTQESKRLHNMKKQMTQKRSNQNSGLTTPLDTESDVSVKNFKKIEFSCTDSNSTDYGVSHAERMRISKKKQMFKAINKASDKVTTMIDKTLANLGSVVTSLNLVTEQNKHLIKQQSQAVIPTETLEETTTEKRQKSPNPRKTLKKLGTEDILQYSAHRIPKNSRTHEIQRTIANVDSVLEYEGNVRGANLHLKNKTIHEVKEEQKSQRSKKREADEAEQGVMKYKFLADKDLQKIEQKDPLYRKEHKKRKNEINAMIGVAKDFQKKLLPLKGNKKVLKKLLTIEDNTLNFQSPELAKIATKMKARNNSRKLNHSATSSGLNNQILIGKVEEEFDKLKDIVEEENMDDLYQNLVSALENGRGLDANARVESTGIHFINQGEVLVVGEKATPNARLSKCDCFGMCDILRKTGPEFLGDVRAGVNQVHTFYFDFEDFKKRLSVIERISLGTKDEYVQRFEGFINTYQKSHKVQGEKLRRF